MSIARGLPATRSTSSSCPASRSTAKGDRLGYGGGYYDRLLPLLSPRAARVAGAFDLQLVQRVPVGPNDIAVDAVVTESRANCRYRDERSQRAVSTRGARRRTRRRDGQRVALAITLAIQIYTAVAATATSVLAPEIGRDLGIAPKLVGVFVGIVYAGSMAASLASGMFIERHGADPRVAGVRAALRGGRR